MKPMVFVDIKEAVKAKKTLEELATAFPNEFRQGCTTLGVAIKSRMLRAMRSGKIPSGSITPLHILSKLLRKRNRGFGGRLQNMLRYRVKGKGPEAQLTVGFLRDTELANMVMTENSETLTKAQRRAWHIKAYYIRKKDGNMRLAKAIEDWLLTGSTKTKPRREFILPFAQDSATPAEAIRIVGGRITSIIERKMK